MLSRLAFWFSVFVILITSFWFYPRWQHKGTEAVISYDVSGYYWYLPSVFIYHDIKHQSFKDSILKKYRPTNLDFQQGQLLENGNYVLKYSSGMAVMYSPFFFNAHFLAERLGYPADGFSKPYQLAIQIGGVLIAILGLWYFRKLLLFYYDDKIVAPVLLLLTTGTNYLNSSAIDVGMSHNWLFVIYVFLLINTHYFHQTFNTRYAVRIGFLVGLATLTRPTDILSFVIPMLWGIDSVTLSAFQNRVRLFRQHISKMALALLTAMAVFSIQLFYWKYVSGHWFVYSYKGQGFNFLHPHFMEYTFSYKSGWLMYCPTMVLAFIGIPFFLKAGRNKLGILSFFFLNYYVVSSWDIWSYGGRAMIQSFPVLFFPIATLTEFIFAKRWLKYLYIILVAFFVYFNTWIMVQYHGGGLYDVDNMTRNYYWRVVGRWHVPEETIFLRDETELFEGVMRNKKLVYSYDFSELTDTETHNDSALKHSYLQLTKDRQNSNVYKFGFSGQTQWLRVEADFRSENKTDDDWKMAQFIVRLMKNHVEKELKLNVLRVNRSLHDGKTKRLFIDVKLPKEHFDFVEIMFWNGGSDQDLYVSNLKVWQFDE